MCQSCAKRVFHFKIAPRGELFCMSHFLARWRRSILLFAQVLSWQRTWPGQKKTWAWPKRRCCCTCYSFWEVAASRKCKGRQAGREAAWEGATGDGRCDWGMFALRCSETGKQAINFVESTLCGAVYSGALRESPAECRPARPVAYSWLALRAAFWSRRVAARRQRTN